MGGLQRHGCVVGEGAFDELKEAFRNAAKKTDDIFRDHSDLWKKYLSDSNPGALEKALEALEQFLNKGDPKLSSTCQIAIIKILIEKCIGHMKPTIKNKATECFNLSFEVVENFNEEI